MLRVATGSRPAKGRPPLRPLVVVPCGRAAGGRTLRAVAPYRWPAAPLQGALAATGRPCRGVGRSRLPLAASYGQPLLAVLAVNALNDSTLFNLITRNLKPIFYTKTLALIPLLETSAGGQASSSLAVST
ncbi:hypothetical protein BHM03_00033172 [Ensete ventricosum]|nr:hypothetical protein BHM03_00033172 [Ensete ventricosum]